MLIIIFLKIYFIFYIQFFNLLFLPIDIYRLYIVKIYWHISILDTYFIFCTFVFANVTEGRRERTAHLSWRTTAKYCEIVERKRTYVLIASKEYMMTQVVAFCFDRKPKEKRFSHFFLALLVICSLLDFLSPFSARRKNFTERNCQRLSVYRAIKFLFEQFFALENVIISSFLSLMLI